MVLKEAYERLNENGNENSIKTSILKVLLKQYMSPTGPNKYLRGIKPTKRDQLKLDLFKIKIWKNCIEKSGKLNFRKG